MTVEKESWHLSKSIPVGLILAIIIQTSGFIWLLSNMDSQITVNKDDIKELKTEVREHDDRQNSVDVKLGRIEQKLENVDDTLKAINRKLDEE